MLLHQAYHYYAVAEYNWLLYQDVCTVSYHMFSHLLKFHIITHLQQVGDLILYDFSHVLSLRCILPWHSLYVVILNYTHSFFIYCHALCLS